MPRDGSIRLSDVETPFLDVVCAPCGRRGRYAVARLMAKHGDARLTDLLTILARSASTTGARPVRGAGRAIGSGPLWRYEHVRGAGAARMRRRCRRDFLRPGRFPADQA
jgi:hypothetical protein